MVCTLILLAALTQTPEVATPARDPGWKYLHKHLLVGAAGELGARPWAGPLSPSATGPIDSAPGLLLGLDFEPVDSPSWIQRHSTTAVILDASRWRNGDFTAGLGLGARMLVLDGAFSPFIGYEVGARYLSLAGASPARTFGLDLVPDVGAQLRVGTSILRLEVGPHFFASFRREPDQWWRARVSISVPF
ncbi:MAG: hypothetical protein ACJ790_06795 [Myxococcaceae bacterium]